jgi:hypothetical protein
MPGELLKAFANKPHIHIELATTTAGFGGKRLTRGPETR